MSPFALKIKTSVNKWVSSAYKLNQTIWSKPIAQMYINNDQVNTRLCLSNFSVFAPDHIDICEYKVQIFNNKGVVIYSDNHFIEKHGTAFLDVNNLIGSQSKYGMVTVSIKTHLTQKLDFIDRFTSHLFVLYYTPVTWGSIGVVHPQTGIVKRYDGSKVKWKSNQTIGTKNMSKLQLLIFNPNSISSKTIVNFQSESGKNLESHNIDFQPFETKLLSFKGVLSDSKNINLLLEGINAPNAKPLIFSNFKGGVFAVSHA